jgi:hypothetical protein
MPLFKYTMIFDYFSGVAVPGAAPTRIGGWSESYYATAGDDATYAKFQTLTVKRLGICPVGTSISKLRIQQVDPTLASRLRKVAYTAPVMWLSDVPQMALKIPFLGTATTGAFLREFRGLPDVQVTTGEYIPTNPFTTAVTVFINELQNGTWFARRRDKSKVQYPVLSISAAGVVVMSAPVIGLAAGVQVQVLRTVNPMTGRRFGYFATVQTFVDEQNFTIVGPKVKASGFGTLRLAAIVPQVFAGGQVADAQAVVRKVGRPLKSYSGRASRHQ